MSSLGTKIAVTFFVLSFSLLIFLISFAVDYHGPDVAISMDDTTNE
jgi:hypothetical protein